MPESQHMQMHSYVGILCEPHIAEQTFCEIPLNTQCSN